MKCPVCKTDIIRENINIQADIAQCYQCNNVFKISEVLSNEFARSYEDNETFDINEPPPGAWIRKEINSVVIGATTRSAIAFFLVPFMIIWTGGSIGGIYGTQLFQGEFDLVMSLFGIPFVMGAVVFWGLAFMAIWGKVELTLDKTGGKSFTGIGRFGFTRRFAWNEISIIKERPSNNRYSGNQGVTLVLEGKKRISFGMGLRENRRYYLYRAIKSILSKIKENKNFY